MLRGYLQIHDKSEQRRRSHTLADYTTLFQEIDDAMAVVEKASDSEANYDKISLYYVTILLLQDQSRYMAGVGFEESTALQSMERAYEKSMAITSTLPYVTQLQDKLRSWPWAVSCRTDSRLSP